MFYQASSGQPADPRALATLPGRARTRLTLYVYDVYFTSVLALGALLRGRLGQAGGLLARREGQGVLEYVALLSGVAIVLVVVFAIFTSIRNRAQATQATIDALPSP